MEELCGRRDLDPEDEQLEQEVGRGKTEREMEREKHLPLKFDDLSSIPGSYDGWTLKRRPL